MAPDMERFLDAMSAEVRRQCTTLREEAHAEADRLRLGAQHAAVEKRRDAIGALERKHALLESQLRDQAEADAARNTFAMYSNLVQEVLAAAANRLMQTAAEPSFISVLLQLLAESLNMADIADDIVVHVREEFADKVRQFLQERACHNVRLCTEGAPPDGVIVETTDGNVKIYNTLTQRLQQQQSAAKALVYRRLFPLRETRT